VKTPSAERSFKWRRLLTFATLAACLVLVTIIIFRITEANPLRDVALGLIALIGVVAILYMAGASAVDWKVLASLRPGLTVHNNEAEHRDIPDEETR
jgi:hypothetical protein